MVKAYVVYGLGIGCHREVAYAYEKAGAEAELVHIRQLLSGEKILFNSQILNLSGGFLHGDILGAGMCAANELEHAKISEDDGKRIKDLLVEYSEKGNVIYGQCNGFQLLVKTGLLPGIDNDYSRQTVTLTTNDCGNYRVAPVLHRVVKSHFAFEGIDDDFYIWCRHGEGKIRFYSDYGLVPKEEGERNRRMINANHVLLRYVDPVTKQPTEEFPHNPNGSVDGTAGLLNLNGNIFAQMGHTEVAVEISRDPRFFAMKDELRRQGIRSEDLLKRIGDGVGSKVFRNIVKHFA